MSTFTTKAPGIMRDLMRDLKLADLDAAAILGNLGGETGGFTKLQEQRTTVKGSRGGYGWAQWTGPRRRAYEAWCKAEGLNKASDAANYGYLLVELRGEQKAALVALRTAEGLDGKVIAFERAFERAGKPNYALRQKYARQALAAYQATLQPAQPAKPAPAPSQPAQRTDSVTVEVVQRKLLALGYTEVGGVDGKLGPMTVAAILAFRSDNGLPLTGTIDDGLIAALDTAKPRKLVPAREDAPAEVVRDKVPEAHASWLTKITAFWAGLVSFLAALVNGVLGQIGAAKGAISPLQDLASDVPGWAWLLLVALIAAALFLIARHGEAKSIEAFQTGARR